MSFSQLRSLFRATVLASTMASALACGLAIWSLQISQLSGQETATVKGALCPAATPTPNPWTKRLPAGWWQKRHEETLAAPGREECRIVFIGDSITDGWDDTGKKTWEKEYVPRKAINLGIVCDSTQHVLWRIDHGALDNLPKLEAVVIQSGTNNVGITRDPPEDIAKGIAAICDKVKLKAPQAKVLLLAIFPKNFGGVKHEVANGLIAKLHDEKQVFFLDINEKLISTEGAIADRVGHLTEKGYELWAESTRSTLEKLMQQP